MPGSGGSTACNPKPEDCFNGLDDDCDSSIDCADNDCGLQAMCVPVVKDDFSLGVRVGADEPCPEGYAEPVTLKRGLRSNTDCDGCSCTISATTCSAELSYFKTAGDCGADINPNRAATADGSFGSCTWKLNGGSPISGAKIASVTPTASCDAKGTGKPKAADWIETFKFCKRKPAPTGGGCGAGQICIAKSASKSCVIKEGEHTCPTGYASAYPWYTGATDNRVCTSCGCSVKGGACPFPSVNVYYGYDCGSTVTFTLFGIGSKVCQDVNYGAVALYTGQVEAAACASSSQVMSGGVSPTGAMAFCCLP